MQSNCAQLHVWANMLPVYSFPYDEKNIPLNGIYILFEKGELGHGTNRIVRIGTHTGNNQLHSRLRQHFLTENKDRSIFRKNIGRCLLAKENDPYSLIWELDMTSKLARDANGKKINKKKQQDIEKEITKYMQKHFSFVVLEIKDKNERLALESKIISTVSHCTECKPSQKWLGNFSPKQKVKEGGLWLVNELYKEPLSKEDFILLKRLAI